MSFKLGKKAPRRLMSTPAFGDFIDKATSWPAVAARGWEYAFPASELGMLGNDQYGNCLVGESVVDAPDATVGYRSKYSGPVITFRTASGKRLTVTPNHPMLTRNGYVPAKSVKYGDDLVSTRGSQVLPREIRSGGQVNIDYAPSPIKKIFSSLLGSRGVVSKMVPMPVHFHGDGRCMYGDIDVVDANGFLGSDWQSSTRKPRVHHQVSTTSQLKRAFASIGSALQRLHGSAFPPFGVVCMGGNGSTLGFSHPFVGIQEALAARSDWHSSQNQRPSQTPWPDAILFGESDQAFSFDVETDSSGEIDFGLVMESVGLPRFSNRNATIQKSPSDGSSVSAKDFSDFFARFSSLIHLDRIIDVVSNSFTGHVFNLSTDEGWYTANGIVTHNCAEAGAMHLIQVETANTGNPLYGTVQQTLDLYTALTGFDPNDPSTDQGTDLLSVLQYWKTQGISVTNAQGAVVKHKILGWASLDISSVAQMRYASDVFGGTYLGINCPQSAEDDTSNWLVVPNSPILGGHCVNGTGQGRAGGHLISWGLNIPFDWAFPLTYLDEAYIVVSESWVNAQGKSPSGLDLNGLLAAMKTL